MKWRVGKSDEVSIYKHIWLLGPVPWVFSKKIFANRVENGQLTLSEVYKSPLNFGWNTKSPLIIEKCTRSAKL